VRLAIAIKSLATPVELTDEQVKQLAAIAKGSEDVRGALREKVLPALEQMLTPEQKAAMTKHRTVTTVLSTIRTRITREQLTALGAAYDELAKDGNLKGEELVKALTEKLNGLLTDEQKQTAPPVRSR
jgi:hypothetical protein